MALRKISVVTGLLAWLVSSAAFSLGLGELTLKSALNEPFEAEIQLLNTGDLSEAEFLVDLASRQDFERAGVEREFILVGLHFDVDLSDAGRPLIRVSSKDPIREPYLDFLIQVQWPAGRVLREYTVLLDLPVYATEEASTKKIDAARAVNAGAEREISRKTDQSQPSRLSRPSQEISPASEERPEVGDEEYLVRDGDTLWSIASRIRPEGTSINQAMVALHQINPDAFIHDDINLLMSGRVLRLPRDADIRALNREEARDAVAAAIDSDSQQTSPQQLDASEREAEAIDEEDFGGGQLKLAVLDASAAAGESESQGTSETTSSSPAEGSRQDDMAVVQEELDKALRENSELKERLGNLEDQISTMRRMVEIQDTEFRGMQVAEQARSEGLLNFPAEQGVINEIDDPAAGVPDKARPDEASAAVILPPPRAAEQPWWKMLLSGVYLYGALGLVVLIAGVIYVTRRRSAGEFVAPESYSQEPIQMERLFQGPEQSGQSEPTYPDESDLDEDEELFGGEEELDEETVGPDFADDEKIDPIGEAEIYLSLENYDLAEKVLLGGLESEPEDPAALHLKLLEVYVATGDLDKFDAQKKELAALNDPAADKTAAQMREELTSDSASVRSSVASPSEFDEDTDFEAEIESLFEEAVDEDVAADEVTGEGGEISDDEFLPTLEENTDEESLTEEFDLGLDLEDIDTESLSDEIDQVSNLSDTAGEESEIEDDRPKAGIESFEKLSTDAQMEQPHEDNFESTGDFAEPDDGADDVTIKLDLARAYMDMGDIDGAREILEEILDEGNEEQRNQARSLMENI